MLALTTVEFNSCAAAGAYGATKQFHPLVAVGRPITPEVAAPPVPTFTRKDAVEFATETDGDVPKPLEMVGAVADNMSTFCL